jgi:hypothetical protein
MDGDLHTLLRKLGSGGLAGDEWVGRRRGRSAGEEMESFLIVDEKVP